MTESPRRTVDEPFPPIIENLGSLMARMRSARDRHFPTPSLFGEPAWDILLSLKAAEGSFGETTVKSVAENSRCALTTAQRWLVELERVGLVQRREGFADRRRTCVSLTAQGAQAMDDALAAMFEVLDRLRPTG